MRWEEEEKKGQRSFLTPLAAVARTTQNSLHEHSTPSDNFSTPHSKTWAAEKAENKRIFWNPHTHHHSPKYF